MKKLSAILLLAFLTFGMPHAAEAQVTVAPFLTSNPQFLDGSGSPLGAGCVFTYAAGTTTPLVTYSDSAGSTPNSNPVILNSGGFPQAGGIWLTSAAYKFVVKSFGGSNCSTGSTITTTDGITWATAATTFAGIVSTGDVTLQQSTAATSGANQSSNNLKIQAKYWNGSASATESCNLQDILGTGANPTVAFTLTCSGSSGATTFSVVPNTSFSGSVSVAGNVTETAGQNQYVAFSFNGVLWPDSKKYTTIGAALADCPSSGGEIEVPPNWTSSESNWTGKTYCHIHHNGPCAVSFGSNTISVPAGVHNFSIDGTIPFGSTFITLTSGCEYTYTGNSTFVTNGASSADTFGFGLKDIGLNLNNAGSAAVALKVVRTPWCDIQRVRILGPGGAITQQGIVLDGTGNYTGCDVRWPIITGVLKGIQLTGSGVNGGNASTINGGGISSPATGSSVGIDIPDGNGSTISGIDIESQAIGVNVTGASNGNKISVRSESNTSGATLGGSTSNNFVELIQSVDPITDSGTNNTTCRNGTCSVPHLVAATDFKVGGGVTFTGSQGGGTLIATATIAQAFQFGCSGTATSSTTLFLGGFGSPLTCTDATGSNANISSGIGTAIVLTCGAGTGGKVAGSGVATVQLNGVDTAVTCTFGTGTSCADFAHSFAITTGDRLRIKYTTQATETLANVNCALEKR